MNVGYDTYIETNVRYDIYGISTVYMILGPKGNYKTIP